MKVFSLILSAVAALGLTVGAYAESSKSVSVGGFVDAQARWKSKTESDGFAIHDGAIYLSKEFSKGKFMLDLPFKWDATAAGSNNDFQFAKGKAQAYLNYSLHKMVSAQIGQWDTGYGFEVNDSVDNTFTDTGLIYGINPVTHTGLMLALTPEVPTGALTVKAFTADANNRGKKDGVNLEYGGQVSYSHDFFHAAAGYLFFSDKSVSKKRHYLDFLLGASLMDRVNVDAEIVLLKDPNLTTGNNDKWGQGYLLNAVLKATDMINLSVRGEMTKKTPGSESVTQVTTGPQIALTEALKLRADYTLNRTKAISGGTTVTAHMINGGAVYRF